ncbi:MAG: hypothetical protein K2K45_10625 [Muribaculaceae bacterium]|nr:hypothetical protein [Muribaculaceae bacterium]
MKAIKQKKSIVTFLVGLFILSVSSVMNASDRSNQSGGDAILTEEGKDPLRKRMPSRNYLEVIYSNGVISLLSETYEGVFSLQFDSSKSRETYAVPFINVGESAALELESGTYKVTAEGEGGIVLSGTMEVF